MICIESSLAPISDMETITPTTTCEKPFPTVEVKEPQNRVAASLADNKPTCFEQRKRGKGHVILPGVFACSAVTALPPLVLVPQIRHMCDFRSG